MRLLLHPTPRSHEFVAENGTADYGGEEYLCVSTAAHVFCLLLMLQPTGEKPYIYFYSVAVFWMSSTCTEDICQRETGEETRRNCFMWSRALM